MVPKRSGRSAEGSDGSKPAEISVCFNEKVVARVKGIRSYTKVDLGIVAYHFEAASGHKVGFV